MKKILLFLLLLCAGSMVMAQETIVTGTIVSSDGEVLPGASVMVKGTMLGTVTDMNGNFAINLPTEKATLVFKFTGFTDKEQNVTAGSRGLQITLSESTKVLNEVVVTGYGTTKKPDLTGAVSSLSSDDIKRSNSTSIEQAMQGRVAGVQITQNSGLPGGGISVSIRGINTLNGNEPLYVIDGVAVSGQTSSNTSVLSSINPADILSIDVLKDASATAIYGSRASNGVIMITTKQGEMGKPKLSYDGYFGLQQLPTKIATMNLQEYAEYYNARAAIQGWGIRDDFRDPSLLSKGTNWQKELFRTAPMQNHNLSVSGGSNGVRYALSGGYLDQDGIGLGTNFRRITFRSNVDMDVAKWLNIGVNGSVASTKQITTLDGGGIIYAAINQRPDVPARNLDGSYGVQQEDQFNTYQVNPLAAAQMRENYNTGNQVYYTFFANLKPFQGMNFRIEYGGNMNYGNSYSFVPNYVYGNQRWTSTASKGSSKSEYQALKTYLTYDRKIAGKFNINAMVGHEAQGGKWESLSAKRINYISNSVHSLNVGGTIPADGNGDGTSSWAIESYFGRLNLNFDNRYLLTGTLRADGSSTFGPNKRWGSFPSAAFAWRISNESFMQGVDFINNMKLRLGWGVVGNQGAGSYAYGTSMATTQTYWGTGYLPMNYGNPDLQWEQTKAYNIGLDLTILNNRIEFIAEAYLKDTDNLLLEATLPTYAVYMESWLSIRPPWVNTGAMQNKGLEFTLNTVNINNGDFFWQSNLTLSLNRNKLTKLYNNDDIIYGQVDNTIYTKTEVGDPIGRLYGYNVIGMFTCEDDFYQKDAKGNFLLTEQGERIEKGRPGDKGQRYKIDETEIWVGDYIFEDRPTVAIEENGKIVGYKPDGIIDEKDRTYLGNTTPKFIFGLNNSFSWKNFELNIFFNGVYGNKVYNILRQRHIGTDGYGGKLKDVAGFARIERIDPEIGTNVISNVYISNAADATAARVYRAAGNKNSNERISSRFVEDGSYLRLKNISLSYSVPRAWLQKNLPVDFLQIYVSVQNLYTFTKYKGFDPEIGSYDVRVAGVDNSRYPSQRQYNFGMRFNF